MQVNIPDHLIQIIANELAEVVADDLFSNSNGDRADRLVLELPGKRDGGGWSQSAAASRIAFIVEKWLLK